MFWALLLTMPGGFLFDGERLSKDFFHERGWFIIYFLFIDLSYYCLRN